MAVVRFLMDCSPYAVKVLEFHAEMTEEDSRHFSRRTPFLAGEAFVIGKITGTKKFFWGLLVGIFYAVLLVLVSFGLYRSIQGSVSELVTTFLVCAGGGMVGGMIS